MYQLVRLLTLRIEDGLRYAAPSPMKSAMFVDVIGLVRAQPTNYESALGWEGRGGGQGGDPRGAGISKVKRVEF